LTHLSLSSLGERALIQRITTRLATELAQPPWVLIGPGDDAAVIEPARGTYDVFTADAVVDGVHFDRTFVPLDAAGHRALAVNLSDLAAMGATPRAALLSLVLPDTIDVDGIDRLLDGLLAVAAAHRVAVIGGNVTRSAGPLVIDVTAIGSIHPRRVLTRGGAKPGDEVWVTGSLGAGVVGVTMLQSDRGADVTSPAPRGECIERYLRPIPRVRAGVLLGRNRAASSCMDVSDGLGDAVHQIAEASGVGMTIDAAAIPLAAGVREWHAQHGGDPLAAAIGASDDYELLFTVRPAQRGRLRAVRTQLGQLPVTKIGVVTKGRDVLLAEAAGTRGLPRGFDHFQ
jgi:thiamine-monophosphate kinase